MDDTKKWNKHQANWEQSVLSYLSETLEVIPSIEHAKHFTSGFLSILPNDMSNPWNGFTEGQDSYDDYIAEIIDEFMPSILAKSNAVSHLPDASKKHIALLWLELELEFYEGDYDDTVIPWMAIATRKGFLMLKRHDFIDCKNFADATRLRDLLRTEVDT